MILTCQKCTKRYLINSDAIGKEGRAVRCVACSHTWIQPPMEDNVLQLKGENLFNDDLPSEPPTSSSTSMGWGWASFIVALFSLATVFITGRDYVTRQWPAIQPLYQRLGFNILKPGAGLVIKNATLVSAQKDGRDYFIIKGEIINAQPEARAIPPLRFYWRGNCSESNGIFRYINQWRHHGSHNQSQCLLKIWTHTFSETRLLPGEKLPFETLPQESVSGAKSIEVRF